MRLRPILYRLLLLSLPIAALPAGGRAQDVPRLIFDTDLGPDSDDAGALAMLHALVSRGEVDLLGVMCSTKSPWCPPCADAINTYYRRPDVPIGALKGPGSMGGSEEWYGDSFNGYVAGHFENDLRHAEYAPNAITLYRQLLASSPDGSVVIASVGPTTNLRDLLESRPDEFDSRTGADLVKAKVRLLSVMGGRYPAGTESNFAVDAEASQYVVDAWPTSIMFSGFEVGEDLLTGPRLFTETPPDNPVRAAYHLWDLYFARRFTPEFDPQTGIWPHSSFDQTSVLYAVRGLRDYWTAHTTGRNYVRADGSNEWRAEPEAEIGRTADGSWEHAYLIEKMPREELARIIEDLMVTPPSQ